MMKNNRDSIEVDEALSPISQEDDDDPAEKIPSTTKFAHKKRGSEASIVIKMREDGFDTDPSRSLEGKIWTVRELLKYREVRKMLGCMGMLMFVGSGLWSMALLFFYTPVKDG